MSSPSEIVHPLISPTQRKTHTSDDLVPPLSPILRLAPPLIYAGDLRTSDSFTYKPKHENPRLLYRIIAMNIGDSRALLGHENGSCIPLSRDHKPDNEEEKIRIINASGKVKYNRVDGDLAVARAIGDFFYKSDTTKAKDQQKVINVPEFRVVETTDVGHFIFLACDGVYDVMKNQEIINFICTQLTIQKQKRSDVEIDIGEILIKLLDHCIQKQSMDNMTCAMIRLVDGGTALRSNFYKTHEFVPGTYHIEGDEAYQKIYETFAKTHGNLTLQQCLASLKKKKKVK